MLHYNNRTKILLWNTLYSLLSSDKILFDTITINQICNKALLHRTTFYKHFSDKYELLQYGYNYLRYERQLHTVEKRLFEPFSLSVKLHQTDFYHTAFNLANSTPYLQNIFNKLMYNTIQIDLKEYGLTTSLVPEKLLIQHIRSTLITLNQYWRFEAYYLDAAKIDQLFNEMVRPLFTNTISDN